MTHFIGNGLSSKGRRILFAEQPVISIVTRSVMVRVRNLTDSNLRQLLRASQDPDT